MPRRSRPRVGGAAVSYSGCAVVRDGVVWLHYTGNVKDDQGRRESYSVQSPPPTS